MQLCFWSNCGVTGSGIGLTVGSEIATGKDVTVGSEIESVVFRGLRDHFKEGQCECCHSAPWLLRCDLTRERVCEDCYEMVLSTVGHMLGRQCKMISLRFRTM